jgi:acyl-CoA thioesterase
MKKSLFLAITMLISGNVFAATDHYVLRDGDTIRHLKVTKIPNDDYVVSADVDFDSAAEKAHCSETITGKAKSTGENELVLKKHSESEASFCELKIKLSPNGAKIEESKDCDNFTVKKCHFSSGDKELIKAQ